MAGGGRGGTEEIWMFFLVNILLIQPLKSHKIFLPNLKYQLKNKYPPLAKNFIKKDTIQLSHMSFTTSVTWVW
jgi:hypothetical protein